MMTRAAAAHTAPTMKMSGADRFAWACAVCAIVCGVVLPAAPARAQQSGPPQTLWGVVDGVLAISRDVDALSALLGSRELRAEVEVYGTRRVWPGKVFADGAEMQAPALVAFRNGLPPVFHMQIAGRCVKIAEIEKIYPGTVLHSLPTHAYPDAAAGYLLKTAQGDVTFFINFHSRCLAVVKIGPGPNNADTAP